MKKKKNHLGLERSQWLTDNACFLLEEDLNRLHSTPKLCNLNIKIIFKIQEFNKYISEQALPAEYNREGFLYLEKSQVSIKVSFKFETRQICWYSLLRLGSRFYMFGGCTGRGRRNAPLLGKFHSFNIVRAMMNAVQCNVSTRVAE